MSVTPAALLQNYSRPALERLARHRRLETRGQSKEALVNALAPLLFDPQAIRHALASLTPLQRRLLDEVCLLGGDAPTFLIQRRLEHEGAITSPPRERPYGVRAPAGQPQASAFEAAIAQLGLLGLMFSLISSAYGSTVDLTSPGQRLYVPAAVLDLVPPMPLRLETTAPPPELLPASPAALLRDVYTILTLADQSPIPLTNRGLIAKRGLVRIDSALRFPENAAAVAAEDELHRLPLLRALLEDLRLLEVRAGALVATESVANFLRQPAAERHLALVRAYRETKRWCELFHVRGLRVDSAGTRREALPPVVAARQRVLAELAEMPAESWIRLDHLVLRLARRAYELLFRRQWPVDLYGPQRYRPSPYSNTNPLGWIFVPHVDEEHGWELVEGGLIRVTIGQALLWLGVVDLGFASGGAAALRVTADGSRLLRNERPSAIVSAPNVVVQPNFQIFAFEPTDESVLFTLDRLADRLRAEQVVEYHLSRESVYRAQRAGMDAAAIIAFLERVSSVALPQNVRRSLEEWGALHERVVVHRGVPLLHAVDAATLDALYAAADKSSIGALLGRRVAPTAAFVAPDQLAAVYQRLLASDRLPALSEGPERQPRPALTLDADGRIEFQQPLPDIAVLRVVQQVAEAHADGSAQLTPASLRQAAAVHELGADEVLAALQRFQSEPLPPAVLVLVRRWARRWGRGRLATVTLLEVDSAEILADLLADPEVGRYLRRLEGMARVAVVRADGHKRVRSALQARGMEVADEQPT